MERPSSCPACGSSDLHDFYQVEGVSVHSVELIRSREAAVSYPTGNIVLSFCRTCGFISNRAFEPEKEEYSSEYESTQGFSPTFNAFANRLANRLIEQYDLHNKDVVEIGCGQGEFITLLCELGNNRGVGFDPAYVEGRVQSRALEQITFVKDYYSEKYTDVAGDFFVCKMTLEHIPDVANFIQTVRRAVGDRPNATVFFQIPDVVRILRDMAFWDVYYEHCSYFSLGSLARVFRASGFDVLNLWKDYDDQYLMIDARPGTGAGTPLLSQEEDLEDVTQLVAYYESNITSRLQEWRERLLAYHQAGKKIVLWGSGSKGVSFLTTLGIRDEIQYTVDINPFKEGTFMAGTGQEIVLPAFLKEYQPDVVIVMNGIYCREVGAQLAELGLQPELIAVDILPMSSAV